jgi:calcineurin-like phosphoesterase family protein
MDYFTSDWHLGHRAIIEISSRPFKNVEEMEESILNNSIRKMKKGDNLYFLGDLSFDTSTSERVLEEINKRKINFFWILGNHDIKRFKKEYETKFVRVHGSLIIKRDKKIIHMNHFPLIAWEKSFRNSFHLYGHIHDFSKEKDELEKRIGGKSLNVNVEMNDYKPYSLNDIFDIMEIKEDNWDYRIFKELENV